MLCPALRVSLKVMILKITDYAGLRNCLHNVEKEVVLLVWSCKISSEPRE